MAEQFYSHHIKHRLKLSNPILLPLDIEKKWRDNFNPDVAYKMCYICCQKILGLHQLTKHLRTHLEEEGPFDCLKCNKKLMSGPLLHEHMRFHYNAKELTETELSKPNSSYSCQLCSQAHFSTAKTFCDHMVQVHNQKPFQCSNCGIGYMHKSNLEDHVKAKHGGDQPDIPCDKCGKMFRTKTSLFVHRREQVSHFYSIFTHLKYYFKFHHCLSFCQV